MAASQARPCRFIVTEDVDGQIEASLSVEASDGGPGKPSDRQVARFFKTVGVQPISESRRPQRTRHFVVRGPLQ